MNKWWLRPDVADYAQTMREQNDMPDIRNDEDFYSSTKRLLLVVNRLLRERDFYGTKHYAALMEAAADLEPYFESNDPRDMGWVNDRGLP